MKTLNRSIRPVYVVGFIVTTIIFIAALMLLYPTTAQQTEFVTVYPQTNDDYFTNPGIGWQRMEYNNPPLLEETVTYPTREDISWQSLNPGQGQYDWSALDTKMQRASDNGQLFSFRIYTMQGESWGGHHVPQWVLNIDNSIIQGGDPNYSNCTYQTYWGMFVNELRLRYDGNPNIAFIDISGYGNFNEWSWTDDQTFWDDDYMNPGSLDGQARVRLADMFIGGNDNSHSCVDSNGNTQNTSYNYIGFQSTQLVMPFAGIQQSTRYVAVRRNDVGLRYDCLGRDATLDKIDDVIEDIWRTAPIVFEFCSNLSTSVNVMNTAENLLNLSHGVLIHENLEEPRDELPVERLLTNVGYRYQLSQAVYDSNAAAGDTISVSMSWQNVGTSPAYTSMGYDFALHVYLLDSNGNTVVDHTSNATVTAWMPAHPLPGDAPFYLLGEQVQIPESLQDGDYELRVAIINTVTNEPINLAIQGGDALGRYLVGDVSVTNMVPPTIEPTATITPTLQPTDVPATEETPAEEPATAVPTDVPPTDIPPTDVPATEEVSEYIYLAEVSAEVRRIRNNDWVARGRIRVRDHNNSNVSGAVVTYSWDNGTLQTCVTNSNGLCLPRKTRIPMDQNATLSVTGVSYPDLPYESKHNSTELSATASLNPVTEEPTTVPPTATNIPPTAIPTQIPASPTMIPTQIPPTQVPPTAIPTQVPPTTIPPTAIPTRVPPTPIPPINVPPVTGDYVYIADMSGQSWSSGGGWTVYIDITVALADGDEPSSATVTGVWHDGTPFSCNASWGWCGARLTGISNSVNTATLTITNVSYAGHNFNPSAGESSISVTR